MLRRPDHARSTQEHAASRAGATLPPPLPTSLLAELGLPPEPTLRARRDPARRLARKAALVYAVVSAVWIALSDWALRQIVGDWAASGWPATVKGFAFVTATAFLLYAIVSRGYARITAADERWSSARSRLDLLVDQMPGFLWTVDRGKRVTSVMGGANDGSSSSLPLEGRLVEAILDDPNDRAAALSALDRALAGEVVLYELETHGRIYETHMRPLRDSSGAIVGAVALSLERTEQVELSRRVTETQRLETVGQLTSGIAHDFNNMLAAILGFTELARRSVTDQAARTALDHVREAGDRAALLTRRLLAFSRREGIRPRIVDVSAVAAGLDDILRRLLSSQIALETSIDERTCVVWADPGQLEQILLNLAVNARDAMPRGGRLRIETRLLEAESVVLIEVTDEGAGMDEATQARAFEPFFTTKADRGGTGLGLANVRAVVEEAGGSIELHSTPGKGTRFAIRLPCAAPAEHEPREPGARPRIRHRRVGATILLAEDEHLVREFVASILRLEGFRVIPAASGREALELASMPGCRIDALLTDVAMPGMDGRELAEHVRALHPDAAVVFASGIAMPPRPLAGDNARATRFVEKPFTAEELLAALDDSLDRAPAPT